MRNRPAGPADSSSGNAPCRSTSFPTTSSRRAPALWRPGEVIDRQVLEGAPQPCSAPTLHQALLAHGDAKSQRRPHHQHRQDLVPPPPGAPDRRTGSATGQRERGHDIHSRFQHKPKPTGHVGADRARRQNRRWPASTPASATLARSVIDSSFKSLTMNKA